MDDDDFMYIYVGKKITYPSHCTFNHPLHTSIYKYTKSRATN